MAGIKPLNTNKKTGAPTPVFDAITNMSVSDVLFISVETNNWVNI
jgi:hypothetical protein